MEKLSRSVAPRDDLFFLEVIACYSKNLKQGIPSPACTLYLRQGINNQCLDAPRGCTQQLLLEVKTKWGLQDLSHFYFFPCVF